MKILIYLTGILSLTGAASCMSPSSHPEMPLEIRRLGGKEFKIQLPKGMKLTSSLQYAEGNYPSYMEWARRPWSPGVLMETRNRNVLVLSHFSTDEFSRLSKADGSMYASPHYSNTIIKHHAKIQVYKTQGGRAPALIRYDVEYNLGVFRLVASVDTHENPNYNSDIEEMISSLETFVLVKAKP